MKKIPFKKTADGGVMLWHYEAPPTAEKRACMIWIHGGGWHSTDPSIFGDNYSYFTEHGIVCFSVDYRLVGDDRDLECKYLQNSLEDCLDAIKFVRENAEEFNIDRNRVIAVGESAGGQLALCSVTAVAEKYGAEAVPNMLIAYNPVTCLTGNWAYNVCNINGGLTAEEFLTAENNVRKYCPYSNVVKNGVPLLLLTGLDDRVTYPGAVYDFYLKYREAGNPAEIVFYEKTEHAFALPEYYTLGSESREDSFERITAFIKKHKL